MDITTAQRLNRATSEFYATHAESFSSTRERPWDGWANVLEFASDGIERATREGRPYRVLDIGCGNLRFERALTEAFPETCFEFHAVDNCNALACEFSQEEDVRFQQLDIIEGLENDSLARNLETPPCDLAVAFGFMHHIPLAEWREGLLDALVGHTQKHGIVAIAFWQFAKDARAAAKAQETTILGCERLGVDLDPSAGDYLLGWQGKMDCFRYCHSFFDDEISELGRYAQSLGATPLAAFSADGSNGNANSYLLFATGMSQ